MSDILATERLADAAGRKAAKRDMSGGGLTFWVLCRILRYGMVVKSRTGRSPEVSPIDIWHLMGAAIAMARTPEQ